MTWNFRKKSREAEVLKRGRALVRAIGRMSDAANSQSAAEFRPSTEAMVRAADQLRELHPADGAERQALDHLVVAGRAMLAAFDVDQDRLDAAAIAVRAAVIEVDRVLGGPDA